MPFDGAEFGGSRKLQLMDAVIALLADERRWCKGELASADGRWSILGAMQAVRAQAELEDHVLRAIKELTGCRHHRIDTFNDAHTTDHALMIGVLHRARHHILAETAESMTGRPNAGGGSRLARLGFFAWLRRRFA